MARKLGFIGATLATGALAAAGYFAYKNRELIRTFVEELVGPPEDEAAEAAAPQEAPAEETNIVIDRTESEN